MSIEGSCDVDVAKLGFGIAGAVDRSVIRRVAAAVEAAGFASFWLNDTPEGDALAGLAEAAQVTSAIRLATGVIPLDRQDAAVILQRRAALDLPEARLTIGVGSGRAAHPLELVSTQVKLLKGRTDARVYVGALGPKMRALAVGIADGLLLNMLSVSGAYQAVTEMRDVAAKRGSREIDVALYVRVSLGPDARHRLEQEARRYEQFPSYAANFARLGIRAVDTAVIASEPADIGKGLSKYVSAVDETVVRAITANDTFEEYQALIDAVVSC